jgi:hypothetical protein
MKKKMMKMIDLLNNDEDLPTVTNNLPTITNNIPNVNHPKVSREMKRLSGFFNPAASTYGRIDHHAPSTEVVPEQPDVVPITEVNDTAMLEIDYEKVDPTTYRDIFKLLKTFEESWNHECPFQQKMWRGAITKEDTKMTLYIIHLNLFSIVLTLVGTKG